MLKNAQSLFGNSNTSAPKSNGPPAQLVGGLFGHVQQQNQVSLQDNKGSLFGGSAPA
jgi:hypothetical protein